MKSVMFIIKSDAILFAKSRLMLPTSFLERKLNSLNLTYLSRPKSMSEFISDSNSILMSVLTNC